MLRIIDKRQNIPMGDIPGVHPRKELLDRFGARSAQSIWNDADDGSSAHIGYYIPANVDNGPLWCVLYEVDAEGQLTPWINRRSNEPPGLDHLPIGNLDILNS